MISRRMRIGSHRLGDSLSSRRCCRVSGVLLVALLLLATGWVLAPQASVLTRATGDSGAAARVNALGAATVADLSGDVNGGAIAAPGQPLIPPGAEAVVFAPSLSGAIPTTITYDSLVAGLLGRVTTDAVYSATGGLSGEWPVVVGGSPYTLTTRSTLSGEPVDKATQYVYEYLEALGYDVGYHGFSFWGTEARNVIGEKPGSVFPEQIVLLAAHIDSAPWVGDAPGADDNASGSAAVMIAADLLAGFEFEYTVRFVFFTGEEQGLHGSDAYAQSAFDAGEDILGVINLDMIAWDAKYGPDIDLHSRAPGVEDDSDALADLFVAVIDGYGLDLLPQVIEDGIPDSDHSSFWARGYAAILAIEDYYNPDEERAEPRDFNTNYHTANDRLSRLNLAYFREFVRGAVGSFTHLARPMRVISGTVTVAGTGSAIAGSSVAVVGAGAVFSTPVTVSGAYMLLVPAGVHTVTASAPGYYAGDVSGVGVETGLGIRVDFALDAVVDFEFSAPGFAFGDGAETVTHTVTITNAGVLSDSYDLALGNSTWPVTLEMARTAPLGPAGSAHVGVRVGIPPGAVPGDSEPVTLTVTSVMSPSVTAALSLRTAVAFEFVLPVVLRND